MKKIVLFGGSGGLGSQLKPYLQKEYLVTSVSSKDVDIVNYESVKVFFNLNHRSEEHTSELQSRFGISYAVFCLKKKKKLKQ